MRSYKFIWGLATVLLLLSGSGAFAQEENDAYNPNSVYPISKHDQLYNKRIWRRMDLREKINQPFFSKNKEITKFLMDRVKDGSLVPYYSDSLDAEMSQVDFQKRITQKGTENEFYPDEFTVLEIVEDLIFDKKRSRQYFDVQVIGMWQLASVVDDPELRPYDTPIAYFRYKDLEKLFRDNPEDAMWYNRNNAAGHLNFADAILLRLFHARITKVDNPDNLEIEDIAPNPQQALFASQEAEYKLMEMEHDLWEY
ncbi:hypothetical protein FUAX_03760 [Fulvitalea axinellae]|uniref:Uncharacterized protein n=1 Tax=Fulvitalea axinellae TaxID=1182444 RepID=A0AAU9CNL5_9BACT|nr:hypothetical protein FUAX_03760 [Fulvitalea axinellae]